LQRIAQTAFHRFRWRAGQLGDLVQLQIAVGAQQEDFALFRRQIGQRGLQALLVATQTELLLRVGLAAWPVMQLLVERLMPALLAARFAPVIDQAIARDLVQPGLEQHRLTLQRLAADQAHPGVLELLLGQRRIAAQTTEKTKQAEAMALIEQCKGLGVTQAITPQQGGVLFVGQWSSRMGSHAQSTLAALGAGSEDGVCRLCASSTSCTNSPRRPKRSSPLPLRASSALAARSKAPV